jgi:hypothetical protein
VTEALVVVVLVALLGAVGVVVPLLSPELVVDAGIALVVLGSLFGLPTGLWYHVRLRAALARAGLVPARWWLHPLDHHDRVAEGELPGVLFWCYLGAGGFLVIVLGCLGIAAGVILEGRRAGVF